MRSLLSLCILAVFLSTTSGFSAQLFAYGDASTCCGTIHCRCGKDGGKFCRFMAKNEEEMASKAGKACHFHQVTEVVNPSLVASSDYLCASLEKFPSLKKGKCGDDHGPAGITSSGKEFISEGQTESLLAAAFISRVYPGSSEYSSEFDQNQNKPPEQILS